MKLYRRSLWVFHLNSGSCNGCDIEILNALAPRQDAERLGVKLVGSPRHADAILFTGPVTREALPSVVRAIQAVPEPKIVLAVGACACGGGIWHDSYCVLGGIQGLYRVLKSMGVAPPKTLYVPGCPPKPEAIIHGIMLARGLAGQRQARSEYFEEQGPAVKAEEDLHRLFHKCFPGRFLLKTARVEWGVTRY